MNIQVMEGGEGTTLSLKGRLDFHSHQQLRRRVEELVTAGKSSLTVDLSEVSFIDSSALGVLLLARESCEKAGGSVTLAYPQGYVDRVLKLCRFDELFRIDR